MKKQLIYISIYMIYLVVIILYIKIKVNFEGLVLLVISLFSFAAIGYHFALLRFNAKVIRRIASENINTYAFQSEDSKSYFSSDILKELESKGWEVSPEYYAKLMNQTNEDR